MFCLFYMVNSVEVSSRTAEVRGKSGKTLFNDYKLNLPDEKSENVHASPKPSVLQEDTPVSCSETHECPAGGHTSVLQEDTAVSCRRTPTEIYNNNLNINNNHDTNSRRPEIGFISERHVQVGHQPLDGHN